MVAIVPSGYACSITVKPNSGYKILVGYSTNFYSSLDGLSVIENYTPISDYVETQTKVDIPDNTKTLFVIFGKVNDGTISVEDVWNNFEIFTTTFKEKQNTINEQNVKDNKYRYLQIYNNDNNTLDIEETFTTYGSIYLHDTSYIAILPNISRIDIPNNTKFAELLGVSTVTSPKGYENCIEIGYTSNLVYNIDENKFYIRQRTTFNTNEILLISCVSGRVRYLSNQFVSAVILPRIQKVEKEILPLSKFSSEIALNKILRATVQNNNGLISASTTRCAAVLSYKDLSLFGKIGFNISNGYKIFYMPLSENVNGEDIEIGDTLPLLNGGDDWITETGFYFDLTHDIKSVAVVFAKVDNSTITIGNVNDNFSITGINYKSVIQETIDLNVYPILENNVIKKADDYNALFKGLTGSVETLIFFSDPHWYGYYEEADAYNVTHLKNAAKTYLHNIKAMYDATPTDSVICGGDWLTAHKQSVAVKALGQIDGFMKQLFGDKYFPVYGNHDNNYQGEKDETADTSANDGALTNQQMTNLWFRKWGRMYYTFLGSNSRFYIFDSGIDWTTTMDSYKWGQVDWFANQLLQNSDDNIILVSHIIELNYQEPSQFGNNITPIVENVLLIAEAFNGRNSITLNGHTYDFSQKTGKVKCMLGGHLHFDASAVVHNIPIKCVTTSMGGKFDVLLFDYGANKLRSVRFGGINWNIDLVS